MANTRYTQLPPVVGLDGFEIVPVDQSDGLGGYVTRRTTTGAIAIAGNGPQANVPYVLAAASGFAPDGRVLEGTAGQISVTDGGAGADIALGLIVTAVTPGTYGDVSNIPQFTVDQYGRITAASNIAISPGTVTSVSVVSANGFAGSVATATTTPAITLSTTITGILQGNGTAISAASTTGTGDVVLANTPTLITPVIGAATGTSLVLTGNDTAAAFIPTGNTAPTDGMYLPAANTLGWAINSAAEMQLTASALSPAVSDGNALGTTSLMWADLFLASGGVINWNNGTYTATQSSTNLALSGTATLGAAAGTTGTLGLLGTTSGQVTIAPQDAAGTYNFNLPTGAGTAGQPLLSGGGGASPMTFGTLGIAGGGTGTTTGAVTVIRRQVFTSSGTYTPHASMLYCLIWCLGGGGGGGGCAGGAGGTRGGAGGGAGSLSMLVASAATIGASQTITIGAAGAAGASGANNGGAGGDTSLGTLCIGKGGSGGQGSSDTASGGAGGVAGTGDVTGVGQSGFTPSVSSGSAVSYAAHSGSGGSSILGGGGAAPLSVTTYAGNAATGYGAGGGGGYVYNTTTNVAGGAGTAGIVIVTEFCAA